MDADRPEGSLVLKRFALALVLVLAPAPARAWPAPPGPAANIRPSFVTGYTSPGGRVGYDAGYGLGAAFEAEHSPAVGLLFRLEWDWLSQTRTAANPMYYTHDTDLALFTWSVGARGYLRPGASLRPFGEFDIGVRLGGVDEESSTVFIPRVGVTVASPGSAGLLIECGANFTTRDPERFLFVPIRLGVIFP